MQLKDERVRGLIASRLDRIYFHKRGDTIIVLLCGGDKSTQAKDITAAKRLAAEWSELNG